MSETSKWDDYFVRVGRYLESRDLESEELDYKRETAQELVRYRDELLSRQMPISIKPNKNLINLAGFRKFPDVLKWLSTGDGADALRELWARYDQQQATKVRQTNRSRTVRRQPGTTSAPSNTSSAFRMRISSRERYTLTDSVRGLTTMNCLNGYAHYASKRARRVA